LRLVGLSHISDPTKFIPIPQVEHIALPLHQFCPELITWFVVVAALGVKEWVAVVVVVVF
jgi:hypothetical protein